MKNELGGKIMTEFVAVRPNTCSYLMDDGNTDSGTHAIKKAKQGSTNCTHGDKCACIMYAKRFLHARNHI